MFIVDVKVQIHVQMSGGLLSGVELTKPFQVKFTRLPEKVAYWKVCSVIKNVDFKELCNIVL